MKIVFFDFVIHFGGAPRSTVALCKKLAQTDEVYVIDPYGTCPGYITKLEKASVKVDVLLKGCKDVVIGHTGRPFKRFFGILKQSVSFYRLRKKLIKKVLEIDPDVICTNSHKPLFFLAISRKLKRYPIIFYARGWFRKQELPWYARWLIKHKVKMVFAISNATSEAMQEWGVPREKIQVVYTTIDYNNVFELSNTPVSDKLPGMNSYPKILVPATLLRTKGQYTAIQAVKLLKDKGYEPILWLVGDISTGCTDNYVQYLKNLISDNNLEKNTFFLGWREDIPALIKLADFIVFPTHTEGSGRVISESMLLKKPVISCPSGGVSDLIIDRQTGLLGPIDDEYALANNIELLLKDENLAKRIVEKAYIQMFEKFSPDKHIELVRIGFRKTLECNM
jgi:glycosyltransferase involved in cell wall biosynthesis